MQLMTETVKTRGGRARATRRKIIDAAAELFVANGYRATTLEQIAARAEVAVQTVYFHFGNKRTVLKEAVDVAAVGDDQPVAVLDRPWLDEARAEQDPRRVIALWTANGREIVTRVGPIMKVVRDAAGVEDEMARQWADNSAQTATAFRVLAAQLEAMDALRVPVDEAVDILCALSGLETYLLLSARGWSPQRWERFVVDSVTHALIGP
jgi:AcrR family transcriptional regulator